VRGKNSNIQSAPLERCLGILLGADEYHRLSADGYDDSPWTREELQALAWERVQHEDCDEYENLPEPS
jgi:hypothetical protein